MDKEESKFKFDFTPNALKVPDIRKQIEEQWKKHFSEILPKVLEREARVNPFITDKVGDFYHSLLKESRECYIFGFCNAAIALVGATAERFAIELSQNLDIRANGNEISSEDVLGKDIRQYARLRLLKKARLLSESEFKNLNEIREKRNKYIHPKEKGDPDDDSLMMLNLMIDVLQSGFFDKYKVEAGKIIPKMPIR